MRTHWIKNGCPTLLLFFTGWAMDERPTLHLDSGAMDVCTCFDYRSLNGTEALIREWETYTDIIIIGWSMGVWAAHQITKAPEHKVLHVLRRIAINGTATPVHDQKGIPETIFRGTLENLNETSLQKFFRRMAGTATEQAFWQQHAPQQIFCDQKKELSAIFAQVEANASVEILSERTPEGSELFTQIWDTALISTRDHIFPPANMHRAWNKTARIVTLDLPHYPFGGYQSWQQIIDL